MWRTWEGLGWEGTALWMAAISCELTVVWDPACSGRVCVWMGEFAQPIWEFIWKLTTVAGISGGGALPSSVGRSASAVVKCGPKLLVPILGPGGGPSSELMF